MAKKKSVQTVKSFEALDKRVQEALIAPPVKPPKAAKKTDDTCGNKNCSICHPKY